ncbi:hypothetical protein P175DRAFT_0494695 [Aspergillus ochraceoroseus IBT 24754]|uniref:Uncharacterized protein n=1 Tax=Aspergillus ochraceoroseus IBT 24754 TaxID=1392256 RepID=A0A2T5LTH2_9EURO|nr:uncharacterized protein P175DRAFT_0494695 [Aspergillus ochraceoroseus IBT 24754]PTU19575.1 hypothetical protein P175DRAFT_0494695 [Aspergillus ochraceoroseus IBT 24754]
MRFCLLASPSLLLEPFLALASLFATAQPDNRLNLALIRWTAAMQKLRELGISDPQNLHGILFLRICLATVQLLVFGISMQPIYRFTLSFIDPKDVDIWDDPGFAMNALCLAFVDTLECLVRRQVPVFRFPVNNYRGIDRAAGLCATQLPLWYDICALSAAVKHGGLPEPNNLERLKQQSESWRVSVPANFLEKFSAREVVLLMGHAKAHTNVRFGSFCTVSNINLTNPMSRFESCAGPF